MQVENVAGMGLWATEHLQIHHVGLTLHGPARCNLGHITLGFQDRKIQKIAHNANLKYIKLICLMFF
jgi:hypothetical protein